MNANNQIRIHVAFCPYARTELAPLLSHTHLRVQKCQKELQKQRKLAACHFFPRRVQLTKHLPSSRAKYDAYISYYWEHLVSFTTRRHLTNMTFVLLLMTQTTPAKTYRRVRACCCGGQTFSHFSKQVNSGYEFGILIRS